MPNPPPPPSSLMEELGLNVLTAGLAINSGPAAAQVIV